MEGLLVISNTQKRFSGDGERGGRSEPTIPKYEDDFD